MEERKKGREEERKINGDEIHDGYHIVERPI